MKRDISEIYYETALGETSPCPMPARNAMGRSLGTWKTEGLRGALHCTITSLRFHILSLSLSFFHPFPSFSLLLGTFFSAMEDEKVDGKFLPKYRQRRQKTDQLVLALAAVVQLVSLVVALVFYNKWYQVSKIGASAVVSSLLCGFSQGLLQLVVQRRFSGSNLLKYYGWGVINGFWTVSNDDVLNMIMMVVVILFGLMLIEI